MKLKWGNVALVMVSGLIGLIVVEAGLRMIGIYGQRQGDIGPVNVLVDDEILDFRLTPNVTFYRNGIQYKINSKGWHDYEYDYDKPDDVFRILFLGDSVLNGFGVELDEIYAKQLERMLNAQEGGPKYEAIMLAIGALNTVQEAHLLEIEGLKYDPDLVVVGYVLNDPSDNFKMAKARERKAVVSTGRQIRDFLKGLSTVHLAYRSLESLAWNMRIPLFYNAEHGDEQIASDTYTMWHGNEESWGRVDRALGKIATLSQSANIPYAIVIFPMIYEMQAYPWQGVHDKVAAAARAHGFEVHDLLETYKQYEGESIRLGWGDYTHPNAEGHRIAAEAIHDELRSRKLIPNSN